MSSTGHLQLIAASDRVHMLLKLLCLLSITESHLSTLWI